MLLSFYFILGPIVTAEIITLSTEKVVSCVLTGAHVNEAFYVNPPIKSEPTQPMEEIAHWNYDDWRIVKSTNKNQTIRTDKRWESFELLDENTGYALKNKHLASISVCTFGNVSFTLYSENFSASEDQPIGEKNLKVGENKCEWYHFSVFKNDNVIQISSNDQLIDEIKLDFDAMFLYFPTTNNKTFWKLHNYTFREAVSVTEKEKSSVNISLDKNLCVSFYASVDKNCFLDVTLETGNSSVKRTIIGVNEVNSSKKWQKIEIHAEYPGMAKLSFSRGLIQQDKEKGYWAIDKIEFCNKETEIHQIPRKNPADEHICETLDDSDRTSVSEQNILFCDNPGFIGKHCNISCGTVLGESYPFCENYKICQYSSNCFCSWGFQGAFCKKTCQRGTWGLFCRQKCELGCKDCHPSTGECLNQTMAKLTEDELPVNVTLTSNEISITSLADDQEDITYVIKLICMSHWCLNKVSEEKVFNGSLTSLRMNIAPFTDYEPIIMAQKHNQTLEKKYQTIRTEFGTSKEIEKLNVYSKNATTLWVRFQLSQPYVEGDTSYNIWYYNAEEIQPPKKEVIVARCKLWSNFLCGEINHLQPQSIYTITVESKETMNLSSEVLANTAEEESDAPNHLHLTFSNNKTFLSWHHPFVTNGPVRKFGVVVKNKDGTRNDSLVVQEPQKVYRYEMSVNYKSPNVISVYAYNQFKGKESRMNATFFPAMPELSSKPLIEVCKGSCHMLIPKPTPSPENSNYSILIDREPNINKITQRFKTLQNGNPQDSEWLVSHVKNYDENYLHVEIGDKPRKMISLNENHGYSIYLINLVTENYVLVFPISISEEKLEAEMMELSISLILIIVASSFGLLLFLSCLYRKLTIKPNKYIDLNAELLNQTNGNQKVPQKIKIKSLEEYIKESLINTNKLLQEFRHLPSSVAKSMAIGLKRENNNKNKDRFNVPYDFCRVVLNEMAGVGKGDYINASYINGLDRSKSYIAAQGPKFSTIRDFWRMIWQEQVETIVMATNFVENKKRKCAEYFPQRLDAICEYGEMSIKLIDEKSYEHYDNRVFVVRYRQNKRQIQHFHLKWNPEDLKPFYVDCLVPLVKRIRNIQKNSTKPIVIHCSNGVKRTGTLILCDLALQMAKFENAVDFYGLLKSMREQRPNMMCSEIQYKLAHLVVMECLMEEESPFNKNILENCDPVMLNSQLKFLKKIQLHDEIVRSWNSTYQFCRSMESYRKKKDFLITQQPTNASLFDFWTTLLKENIRFVIFLNKASISMCPYLQQTCDLVLGVRERELASTDYCTYTKRVITKYPDNNINVDFLELKAWNWREAVDGFLNILDNIKTFDDETRFLVACRDGVTASGIFVTLSHIIDKHQNELEIDICGSVRAARRTNPNFVNTLEELEFLHKAVLRYLQKFDNYSFVS